MLSELIAAENSDELIKFSNYSAKKVKRSKKRLDRVFLEKAKMHLCPSVLSILA